MSVDNHLSELKPVDDPNKPLSSNTGLKEDPRESKVKLAATKVAKGLSSSAESMSSVVKKALQAREHVIMVRVNEDALRSINHLKDAGLFRSRSEAAAYLIAEGISAKAELFAKIMEKIEKISKLRDELRALAGQDDIFENLSVDSIDFSLDNSSDDEISQEN